MYVLAIPNHSCSQDTVNKVLRGQISKMYKKNAAVAFVKGRLGKLCAEERRQVSFFYYYVLMYM